MRINQVHKLRPEQFPIQQDQIGPFVGKIVDPPAREKLVRAPAQKRMLTLKARPRINMACFQRSEAADQRDLVHRSRDGQELRLIHPVMIARRKRPGKPEYAKVGVLFAHHSFPSGCCLLHVPTGWKTRSHRR